MEKNRIVLFNILEEKTKSILQSVLDGNENLIREVRKLLKGISGISEEELESIETVDDFWHFIIMKKVISMNDLQVLKYVAKYIESKELEKELKSYEYESSGMLKTAKLVIRSGLSVGIGLAVLSFCGENESAKQVVLEKLVLPPLMKLDEVCEGSVCFIIETTSLSSLKQLWRSYKDGSLKKKFQKVINEIDEVRKLTQGKEIDVTVEIDEEEYREACWVLMLAETQEVQAKSGRMEKRRRHSLSCDQCLPDKTLQPTWAEWMNMKELEDREEAKKQIGKLRQEVEKLKHQSVEKEKKLEDREETKKQFGKLRQEVEKIKQESVKKEEKLRNTINKKVAELKLVQRVNEELLKDRCYKALSLSKSLQMLKVVKHVCLDFISHHESLSMNIEDMKQGEEDAKKVVFESIGKYHIAIRYLEKCLNAILDGSETVEINIHGNLGNLFNSLSNYHQAMECYKKALEIAENSGTKKEQMTVHRNLGIVLGKLNQDEEAIQHHKIQMQIAKEIGDKIEEGTAYKNLGAVYFKVQEYEEALEYYKKLLKIAEKSGNKKEQMTVHRNLGIVLGKLNQDEEAIQHHKIQMQIAKEIGDKIEEETAYKNLGAVYFKVQEYEEALEYYKKLLKIAEKSGNKKEQMKALGSLGESYEHLQNYKEVALNYAMYAEVSDDIYGKANAYENLGNAYKKLGKDHEALKAFNTCLSIAIEINDKEIQANVYGSQREIYESLKITKEAVNCENQRKKLMEQSFQSHLL